MVSHHDFRTASDSTNNTYTFQLARWVGHHFDYLTYATSDEIVGYDLPVPIQSLISGYWPRMNNAQLITPSGSTISLNLQSETIPLAEPTKLQTIVDAALETSSSFDDSVSVANKETNLSDIVREHYQALASRQAIQTAIVTWYHPTANQTGLLYVSRSNSIAVYPFANQASAVSLYDFCLSENKNASSLSQTMSELIVLAALHCQPRQPMYKTASSKINDFVSFMGQLR